MSKLMINIQFSGSLTGLLLRYSGRTGSVMPVEAWYDGTCFLDTPSFRDPALNTEERTDGTSD